MRKKLFSLLLLASITAYPAFADFEGTLEMKLNMADTDGTAVGGGTMNLSVGKPGSRMEMNMRAPMAMKMVMITKTDTPDKVFQVNHATRTYSEISVAKDDDAAKESSDKDPWTVKKLGEEKVLDYKTQHVLVTHKQENWELWTSKDLIDYATYQKLQASRGKMADAEMVKALKKADADGMPLKAVVTQAGVKTTIELVKVDKKSLPASTFEIPSDYTKTASGFPGFGAPASASDPRAADAKKKLDEALKNMTPEQREMYEKLIKQRQGASPSQP
jgi:hypothetical protein